MCGRYASSRRPEDLAEEFEIDRGMVSETVAEPLAPDYNVAPTKEVYAVVTRPPQDESTEAAGSRETAGSSETAGSRETAGERQLRVLRWGLVPFWAKDPSIGSKMINARMETVDQKPAFRRAF